MTNLPEMHRESHGYVAAIDVKLVAKLTAVVNLEKSSDIV